MPRLTTAVLATLLLAAPARADDEVTRLAGFLTGSFSSKDQSEADAAFFDVRLHSCRVWPERADGYWLYVEQAMATALDKPYRQRVYRVCRLNGRLASVVYTLPGDPLRFAGAWKADRPLAGLKPDDLTERAGCAIYLTANGGGFDGATEGKGCASDLRGAKSATSEVTVTADTLASWDRGFDAAGKQVWGAAKGPYRFKREPAGRE